MANVIHLNDIPQVVAPTGRQNSAIFPSLRSWQISGGERKDRGAGEAGRGAEDQGAQARPGWEAEGRGQPRQTDGRPEHGTARRSTAGVGFEGPKDHTTDGSDILSTLAKHGQERRQDTPQAGP